MKTSVCRGDLGPTLEPLEPRLLLAADVVISEIMYQALTDPDLGRPEDYGEEFIELYNRGDAPADLLGWKFTDGIDFEFPDVAIGAGEYLVVAANPAVFQTNYPAIANYVSDYGWDGHLSNSGERIALEDDSGQVVDQVEYADEGDWAERERLPDPGGGSGYVWSNLHDGGGRSLELINPWMTNNCGQNWSASLVDGGTPGEVNSVDAADIAPLIRNVEHYPIIPTAAETVTVRAKIQDELAAGLTAVVRYRDDGDPSFSTAVMYDDGLHDDEVPGDGIYAAELPERPDGTIVEFYVQATDAAGNSRTWPAPVAARGQVANCLYQVDDGFSEDWTPGSQPVWRVILTAAEWSYLDNLEENHEDSNAQMNATFITTDGVSTKVRYEVGIRHRGNGSRGHHPHNQRINIPHDRPWQGYTAVTMNTQRTHSQIIGSAVFRYADIPAADATAVRFLINGVDHADAGSDMYGCYVALEALDSDLVANHWPDDDAGHLYKCNDSNGPAAADLDYDGEDPDNYNIAYVKQTNVAADDYSGLIHMLYVLNEAPEETYLEDVAEVIDIEQWVRFLAVDTLLANGEGGLTDGRGDDYALYQGVEDPRFTLVPYDLDTVLGTGSQSQTDDSIWDYRRTGLHGLSRLLSEPEVVQMYYAQLLELSETVFSPGTLNPLIDQALAWAPAAVRENMKTFAVQRVANVRGQVSNDPLSVQCSLPVSGGYPRTTDGTVGLSGTAGGAYTRSVVLNGRAAEWDPENGTWWFDDGAGSYEEQTLITSDAFVTYHVPTAGDVDLVPTPADPGWTAPDFDDAAWIDSITLDAAGVLVTEISTGQTRFVEIENVSDHAIDTTGWLVLVNDASGGINAVNGTAWSLGASLAAGEVLYQTDDVDDHYWGATIDWGPIGPGWAMIVDDGGLVRDFLAWGYTAGQIASLDVSYGGFTHITVGEEWSGDGAPVGTADAEMPTADITDVSPDPRNSAVSQIQIVFSEPVSGFDLSDLSLTRDGGPNLLTTEALSSGDDTTWTLSGLAGLTGASGTYALTLTAAGSGIQDATGNPLAGDASDTWLTDADAPTADITDVAPDPHNAAVSEIEIVFSEPVSGFGIADLSLTRDGGGNLLTASQSVSTSDNVTWTLGGLSGLTSAEGTYTLTLTAAGSGIQDGAGNPLAADASDTWETVGVAPIADVVDVTPDPRSAPVDEIEIVFSEPVSGFDLGDLSLTLDGGGNLLTAEALSSPDNITWTLGGLAGLTDADGTYTLTLTAAGSGIQDAAGNPLAGDASDVWVMNTQMVGWVAFNDHVAGPGTHPNATTYAGNGTSFGELRDINTGSGTGATLTITASAIVYDNNGADPPSGSDAFNFFNGFVDFSAATGTSIEVEGGVGALYTHTFSGLDTGDAATYDFVGTVIRGNNAYTDRWTLIALVGADAFTPAHSTGDGVVTSAFNPSLADNQVAIWAGDNSAAGQGWVAHWTDIDPGADGGFAIVSQQYTGPIPTSVDADGVADGPKTYGVVGIRLEEVAAKASPAAAPAPRSAKDGGFVAYNDHIPGGGTHPNTTDYSAMSGEAHSGLLKDIDTGEDTTVTLEVTASGVNYAGSQANPASGTDAYDIFDGYVDFGSATGASLEVNDNDHYTYTFSNLDTGGVVTYNFHGTAVRGNSGYTDRWTLVTLLGADGFTPDSSSGEGVVTRSFNPSLGLNQVAIWTGHNSAAGQGYVAGWTGIDPGSDGVFSVVSQQYTGAIPTSVDPGGAASGSKGYGISGIRLEEVAPSGPQSWLKRMGDTDGNDADDFARSSADSKGLRNPNMTVPFGTAIPTTMGIGFSDGQPEFDAVIETDLGEAMENVNASVWSRIEFTAGDLPGYDGLTLRMKYDDGFVAYLNGTEVARRNADNPLSWNTAASAERPNGQAVLFEDIDISAFLDQLVVGTNVLAIHGLNIAADDADFLLQAELIASRGTPDPGLNLFPGLNRVVVQAFDGEYGTGNKLDETYIDIWSDTGGESPREISGALAADITLDAAGPWTVTGDLTVPAGITLTVAPGAEVYFNSGVGITVNGMLHARGTEVERITFASATGQEAWGGFRFIDTAVASEIAYADIDNSDAGGESIYTSNGDIHLDHVVWSNHSTMYLDLHDCSVRVTNCVFPDIPSGELVHYWGYQENGYVFPDGGYALIQGNTFGTTSGYSDIIDFTGGQHPGPVPQFLDNVFLGGGDDGLDVDACDAHVEGNVFMHFHQDAPRESLSHALSTGVENGVCSRITAVRNLFYDVDHAILIKDSSYATIVNNTIVHATEAAINLYEARSGQWEADGLYADGNIFYDVAAVFANTDWDNHTPAHLEINNSLFYPAVAEPVRWTGCGNLDGVDPLLVEPAPASPNGDDLWSDFALLGASPATGMGPNGKDIGGVVPAGPSITGEPESSTHETSATLVVGGPEICGYRYRVDVNGVPGAWSGDVLRPDPILPDQPVRTLDPIELTGLADGAYQVYVIQKNSAGFWQDEADATASELWTVGDVPSGMLSGGLAGPVAPAEGEPKDAASVQLTVPDGYLPGEPVLVRVEVLDQGGNISRDLWDATAALSADSGVTMDVDQITLFNGLGSALVTFSGGGPFNLTADVNGMQDSDDLTDLTSQPVTTVSGTLSDFEWSGVIHVTGDVLVPSGQTLTIDPGTLIRIDGVASGSGGTDIDVEGEINALGTEDRPITFTAYNAAEAWGEIHHNGSSSSLYRYANIIIAGNSPGGGHTGAGPAVRPVGSTIVFEHTNFTDNAGKVMQSGSGSDLTFRHCHLARSVMGPEIDNTALLFEDSWITENHGPDDNDGIYIHGQGSGQDCILRRGVIADMTDDGLDTLHATVVVEDYIFRNMVNDKGISVYGGEVTLNGIISVNNDIGISAKDGSHAVVHMDHATISNNRLGIQAENKGGGMPNGLIEYFVTNSIVYGNSEWAVRSDYPLDPIHFDYSIVGESWISDGGYRGVPDEVHTGEVWPGVSNDNTDPLFVSPAASDFHLQQSSPAIDAGSDGRDLGYYADSAANPVWRAEDGPFYVTGDLTVPSDSTLTIRPGTTVFFEDGASLVLEGRLIAEGTAEAPIRFAPAPGASSWDGLQFVGNMNDNVIRHAILGGVHRADGMIELDDSRLTLEHSTLEDATRRRISAENSSLIVRDCVFTDLFETIPPTVPNNISEHIWGGGIAAGGVFLIENNVFGTTPGHNDAIDFDAGWRPDPIPQILNNTFLGGGDDALDLETDAHIEGNVFLHYRKDQYNPDPGESNAISAGGGTAGSGHHFVVARNVFYDCDHAVLAKEWTFLTFANNTVVGVSQGTHAALAGALYFDLAGQTAGPGDGAYVEGCIFQETDTIFAEVLPTTRLEVNDSLVNAEDLGLGTGNITGDARLSDPGGGDFSLANGSPAIGTGPVGRDMGADVPAGVLLSPVPAAETYLADATFQVSGHADAEQSAVLAYKYRLNAGGWSAEQTPGTPISLTGLTDGPQVLEVVARSSAGVWQDEADANSASWTVDTALSRVRINEVLARNAAAYDHEGTYPDIIELYNDSPAPTDISGWSITDNVDVPTKFVFPEGTTIAAEGYLLLFADDATTPTSGIHLDFGVKAEGDDVWLFDAGEAVVDSVEYGLQVADLSIGRVGPEGAWALTQPTFDPTGADSANIAQPTADPTGVLINEWFANGDVVLVDDFLELYNPDTLPVDVGGLYLTDNPANQKTKHEIRPLSFIGAGGFQALKADDRDDPGHMDFRLRALMEILGLFDAEINQMDRIYYCPQTEDVSQGRSPDGTETIEFFTLPTPGVGNVTSGPGNTVSETLVAETDPEYVLVPAGDIGTAWRTDLVYDTSGWHHFQPAPPAVAIGYDSGDDRYRGLIGLDLEGEMDDTHATCYIRIPFTFTGEVSDVLELWLNVRYDDGFIAYLNGREIRREHFPATGTPRWDSEADDTHSDGLAVNLEPFDVSDYVEELNVGDNLLAIHALNAGVSSSDFLISAELVATVETSQEDPFAHLLALHNDLRITEIMYNQPGSDSKEFIELRNTGTMELNLGGIRFTEGVDFVFPEMMLSPGQYVVLARDLEAFQEWYPDPEINAVGSYDATGDGNPLDNGGEDILFQMPEPYDAAILRFEYDDDWYPSTDGDGASLVINDPLSRRAAWRDADAWHPSSVEGGSPGEDDPVPQWPLGAVVINEVLAHSDDPDRGDWIELHNTTATDIDISGWFLSDDPAVPEKYVIPGDPSTPMDPGNTVLPAGGYIAFNEIDHFGAAFGLSELGDEVLLSSCDLTGALGTYRDSVVFGATANSVTLGRHSLSSGKVDFVAMREPDPDPEPEWYRPGTYGYANAGPLVGPIVIEEIMYHPPEGGSEYVLLRNVSGESVPLYDPLHPENTWEFTDGIDFVFPEDIAVPADGFALITDVDPATYLAARAVPANVQVFGPFLGALSNGCERITLARPGKPETLPGGTVVPQITVESIKYNDSYPWPKEPDGTGPALGRLASGDYGNEPLNWGVSGAPVVTVDSLVTDDPSPQLTGTISDTYPPTTVTVTVDGAEYTAGVTGSTWTLPDDTIVPLGDGVYDVAVTAYDAAGNRGTDDTVDELVIDAASLTAQAWYSAARHDNVGEALLEVPDDGTFSEPRRAGVTRLVIQFSEPIDPGSLTPGSVLLAGNDASGEPVELSSVVVTTSTRAGGTIGVIDFEQPLPDVARYLVRIEGVTDTLGDPLTGDADRIFSALAGDANSDLRVNAIDLSYLWPRRTTHIDGVSADQTRSDVTCDGRVNAIDLSATWPRRGGNVQNVPDPVLPPAPGGADGARGALDAAVALWQATQADAAAVEADSASRTIQPSVSSPQPPAPPSAERLLSDFSGSAEPMDVLAAAPEGEGRDAQAPSSAANVETDVLDVLSLPDLCAIGPIA